MNYNKNLDKFTVKMTYPKVDLVHSLVSDKHISLIPNHVKQRLEFEHYSHGLNPTRI